MRHWTSDSTADSAEPPIHAIIQHPTTLKHISLSFSLVGETVSLRPWQSSPLPPAISNGIPFLPSCMPINRVIAAVKPRTEAFDRYPFAS